MQDKDCCENCIYFLEGKTEICYFEEKWADESFIEKLLCVVFFMPRRRRDLVVETWRTRTNPVCRKGHQPIVKDKAEWCGEYEAKD